MANKYFTTGDVARAVGVSVTTIDTYIKKGILKPDVYLPSGRRKFRKETVENFVKSLKEDN